MLDEVSKLSFMDRLLERAVVKFIGRATERYGILNAFEATEQRARA